MAAFKKGLVLLPFLFASALAGELALEDPPLEDGSSVALLRDVGARVNNKYHGAYDAEDSQQADEPYAEVDPPAATNLWGRKKLLKRGPVKIGLAVGGALLVAALIAGAVFGLMGEERRNEVSQKVKAFFRKKGAPVDLEENYKEMTRNANNERVGSLQKQKEWARLGDQLIGATESYIKLQRATLEKVDDSLTAILQITGRHLSLEGSQAMKKHMDEVRKASRLEVKESLVHKMTNLLKAATFMSYPTDIPTSLSEFKSELVKPSPADVIQTAQAVHLQFVPASLVEEVKGHFAAASNNFLEDVKALADQEDRLNIAIRSYLRGVEDWLEKQAAVVSTSYALHKASTALLW